MDGILLVDKPIGITSHDVVAKVRHILRQAKSQELRAQSKLITNISQLSAPSVKPKVGHTGTLDPAATGLMILVIGKYTKRASEFSKLDKTYEVEITLGSVSTTADSEGEITPKSAHEPSRAEVESTLNKFIGDISQTPPVFSAIKVDGQRAYKLARAGKEVKIEPRKVTIYQLLATTYQYPKLCFTARVSSGTYIRSLAEDIGQTLGTGAYLSALRRTQVAEFDIKNTHKLSDISPETLGELIDKQG